MPKFLAFSSTLKAQEHARAAHSQGATAGPRARHCPAVWFASTAGQKWWPLAQRREEVECHEDWARLMVEEPSPQPQQPPQQPQQLGREAGPETAWQPRAA